MGSNSRRSVSYPYFCWALPSSGKRRVDEGRPIAFKTRFVEFPHRGETKKHPCDRIPRGQFHTTILGGIFEAAQNAGFDQGRPIGLKTRFFEFPHWGETKKHPCDQIPQGRFHTTILGGLAFTSSAKRRVDEGRFFDFPHRGETKKHPWDRIPRGRFHTPIFAGLYQAAENAGLTKIVQLRSKLVLSSFPIGAKRKNTLVTNSTRSASYHHFGWVFPSSAKRRFDQGRPIGLKTRFVEFPHRDGTKKHPWDQIPRDRFHTTIFAGLFQAVQKGGLTNVVQLR